METTRQNKIARLIQKEISEIFLGMTRQMPGTIVSTTIVRISPDLSVARIYLSIFPTEKSEELLEFINSKSVSIRHDLAARTRFQLRTVPTLSFFKDDSLDYIDNIDNLLKKG
ncbi:MAG: 30S ribosome-binding factor RbfA [Paludibacteraceae bacterium]|nr:30S ribosome-binding factor RbfA [Paludibacteraceae bacterium]MBR4483104.1 30S ribosome-binding factor RbfA [Paludibacteraceae bacterium]